VRIEAHDDQGRERLVRSFARPCFALERLTRLRDGRLAYRVKYAGRGGTHRVMTPVELLARLAALVAPPRYPLVRYHGVLGATRQGWSGRSKRACETLHEILFVVQRVRNPPGQSLASRPVASLAPPAVREAAMRRHANT
jgi:hypothetical protein